MAIFAVGNSVTLHAFAADSVTDRHAPYLLSPQRKPAGVPAEYVLTRSGFFHPSCVITVGTDEISFRPAVSSRSRTTRSRARAALRP